MFSFRFWKTLTGSKHYFVCLLHMQSIFTGNKWTDIGVYIIFVILVFQKIDSMESKKKNIDDDGQGKQSGWNTNWRSSEQWLYWKFQTGVKQIYKLNRRRKQKMKKKNRSPYAFTEDALYKLVCILKFFSTSTYIAHLTTSQCVTSYFTFFLLFHFFHDFFFLLSVCTP